jgi:hypothetical protein
MEEPADEFGLTDRQTPHAVTTGSVGRACIGDNLQVYRRGGVC